MLPPNVLTLAEALEGTVSGGVRLRTSPVGFSKISSALTYKDKFQKDYFNYVVPANGTPEEPRIEVPRGLWPAHKPPEILHRTYNYSSNFVPRNADQTRVLTEAYSLIRNKKSFVIQAFTGFGKSYIGSELVHMAGFRTLIVFNKSDLANQWKRALTEVLGLMDIPVLTTKTKKAPESPVALVCLNTAARMVDNPILATYQMCLIDEVDVVATDTFSKALFNIPAPIRVGLSATIERSDGRQHVFIDHIGPVAITTESSRKSPTVITVESEVKSPKWMDNMDLGKPASADKLVAENQPRNNLICNFTSQAYSLGRYTIILAQTKKHCNDLLHMLIHKYSIPADDVGLYYRGLKVGELKSGLTKKIVIGTMAFCSRGTDVPRWDTLIMAVSRANVNQHVGRILNREHPDKDIPLILDILDRDVHIYNLYSKKRFNLYREFNATIIPVDYNTALSSKEYLMGLNISKKVTQDNSAVQYENLPDVNPLQDPDDIPEEALDYPDDQYEIDDNERQERKELEDLAKGALASLPDDLPEDFRDSAYTVSKKSSEDDKLHILDQHNSLPTSIQKPVIGLKAGMTLPVPTMDFTTVRFDVSLHVPTDIDALEDTYQKIEDWVNSKVDKLVREVLEAGNQE